MDWERFATFLAQHVQDPTFEPSFRQAYAQDRTRDEEAYARKRTIVHSIWRVNGRNRQVLDELVARLERSGGAVRALVQAVRSCALVRIRMGAPTGTCTLTGAALEWPRTLECLDEEGRVVERACVSSDVCLWLRCVNVLAHFVEFTSARLVGAAPTDEWLETHWGVWTGCVALVERWSALLEEE